VRRHHLRKQIVSAFDVAGPARPELDLAEFSRFKHGAVAPAWRFASELVRRLDADCPEIVAAPRLVVTASCYKFVPLASVTLTRAVAHLLNARRAAAARPPVTRTQFYRSQLIEGDYSTMTLGERKGFIEQDVIRVDTEVLDGAAVVVVDDVRITGFHEGRIAAVLEEAGVPEAVFAYCAVIDGTADPTIERRMNQTVVGDLDSLTALIHRGGFVLNSRVCKLILSAPQERLSRFLHRLPLALLVDLMSAMECNGYAVMDRFRPAYSQMLAALHARTLQAVR
jgi:hypothetical protein